MEVTAVQDPPVYNDLAGHSRMDRAIKHSDFGMVLAHTNMKR